MPALVIYHNAPAPPAEHTTLAQSPTLYPLRMYTSWQEDRPRGTEPGHNQLLNAQPSRNISWRYYCGLSEVACISDEGRLKGKSKNEKRYICDLFWVATHTEGRPATGVRRAVSRRIGRQSRQVAIICRNPVMGLRRGFDPATSLDLPGGYYMFMTHF